MIENEQDLIRLLSEGHLDIFEQARAMQELCAQHRYTQATLAKALSVSQSYVGNKVRLLQFSEYERSLILNTNLTERHARALLRVSPPKREKLLHTVAQMHLTVQQTEELVEKYAGAVISDISAPITDLPSVDTFISQTQLGAERLRALGYKTTTLTESGDTWTRITITVVE